MKNPTLITLCVGLCLSTLQTQLTGSDQEQSSKLKPGMYLLVSAFQPRNDEIPIKIDQVLIKESSGKQLMEINPENGNTMEKVSIFYASDTNGRIRILFTAPLVGKYSVEAYSYAGTMNGDNKVLGKFTFISATSTKPMFGSFRLYPIDSVIEMAEQTE